MYTKERNIAIAIDISSSVIFYTQEALIVKNLVKNIINSLGKDELKLNIWGFDSNVRLESIKVIKKAENETFEDNLIDNIIENLMYCGGGGTSLTPNFHLMNAINNVDYYPITDLIFITDGYFDCLENTPTKIATKNHLIATSKKENYLGKDGELYLKVPFEHIMYFVDNTQEITPEKTLVNIEWSFKD